MYNGPRCFLKTQRVAQEREVLLLGVRKALSLVERASKEPNDRFLLDDMLEKLHFHQHLFYKYERTTPQVFKTGLHSHATRGKDFNQIPEVELHIVLQLIGEASIGAVTLPNFQV